MTNRFQRFVVSCLIVAAAAYPFTASAGLQDALDGMFVSNGTSPQAFQSQTRGGLVFGGATLRAPIRSINLVAFDPPRLSAGCGGIDMFGGSFSFINADQLVALFRQIAANAVGLAFKAAIDAINPSLGKQMQEFAAKLQALNENMRNTCAIANQIVKSVTDPSARKEEADNQATAAVSATGGFSDLFSGITSLFSSPNGATKTAAAAGTCNECGNVVWKAIVDSNSAKLLGNPDTSSDSSLDTTNMIVMSLVGAVIMNRPDTPDTSSSGGVVKPEVGGIYGPPLTLISLRDGSAQKPMYMLQCTNGTGREECTQISEEQTTFDGTIGYTNRMLFGDPKGIANGVAATSIIGKLEFCSSDTCGFTAAQQLFINSISTPLLGLVRGVQTSPGAVEVVASQLVEVIGNELALKYGEAAMRAVGSAWNGTKITKPDFVTQYEKMRVDELMALRREVAQQQDKVLKAKEIVKMVVANNPGVFVKLPRR